MEKREDTLRRRFADRFDLPAEVIAGAPRLEMTGFTRLMLEPNGGVLHFSEESIAVRLPIGVVEVEGSGLEIRLMNQSRIVITGQIRAVRTGGTV